LTFSRSSPLGSLNGTETGGVEGLTGFCSVWVVVVVLVVLSLDVDFAIIGGALNEH
jgi:hypothetical protein